jgi:hypothetical protein
MMSKLSLTVNWLSPASGFYLAAAHALADESAAESTGEAAPSPHIHLWALICFADFRDGEFSDCGTNAYVSAEGPIPQIHHGDLDDDGQINLVLVNTHPQVEKLDATIYWGNGRDFDDTRTAAIPNDGAQWIAAADVNVDGQMDAVVPKCTNGTWSMMDSAVYYGGIDELGNRPENSTAWGFTRMRRFRTYELVLGIGLGSENNEMLDLLTRKQ